MEGLWAGVDILFKDIEEEQPYIRNVKFSEKAKSLERAKEWTNIPTGLCIITGRNGVGKSHLLEYINSLRHSKVSYRFRHIYLGPNRDNPSSLPPLLIKSQQEEIIAYFWENLRRRLISPEYPRHAADDTMKIIQAEVRFTRKQKKRLTKKEKKNIKDRTQGFTEDEIRQIVLKYVPDRSDRYNVDSDKPMTILQSILAFYKDKEDTYYTTPVRIEDLLQYRAEEKHGEYDEQTLISNVEMQEELRKAYLKKYIVQELGDSPVEEINKILLKYGSDLEVHVGKDDRDDRDFRDLNIIWFQKRGKPNQRIHLNCVSSGEKMILEMLSWVYYHHENSRILDHKSVSVMLLDEPDSHLDPKLIDIFFDIIYNVFVKEKKIQVIFTTHRPDTIALAPKGSIFVLERDKKTDTAEVVPVHKLKALFRLTSNVREITNLHFKVYVESTSDARVYQGVYQSLLNYCQEKRDEKSLKKNLVWKLKPNSKEYRLLSRRYQLVFMTVSTKADEDGGWTKIKEAMLREKNAIEHQSFAIKNKFTRKLTQEDPRMYNSYAIIDNDEKRDEYLKIFEESEIGTRSEPRIAISKVRYSMENFLFDPFIFCSVLTEEELKPHINYSCIKDQKDNFLLICKEINEKLQKSQYENIQDYLERYFKIMFNTIKENTSKPKHPGQDKWVESLKAKVDDNSKLFCDEQVTIIVNMNETLEVKYPKEFLRLNGHFIGEKFIGIDSRLSEDKKGSNIKVLTNLLTTRIYEKEIKLIPQELADTIFDLNEIVRSEMKKIVA